MNGGDVVAVVPARGGSKGIQRKNMMEICGLTLTARAVLCARAAGIKDVLLSTDDAEIANEGRRFGASVPALRPAELATDTARTVDAVLDVTDAAGMRPSIVVLLQPTAPLRRSDDVIAALKLLADRPDAEAVVSLVALEEPHPSKTKRLDGGWVASFVPGTSSEFPRQSLEAAYRLNGAIYAVRSSALEHERTLLPARTLPYVMPPERSVNLDTNWDVILLKALIAAGEVAPEAFADA